jgi:3-hydroxyacyl-[acyl-carrier-protein] dehydratase
MGTNNDIFITANSTHTEGQIITPLHLNTGSGIFKGHFPGRPVVPGACMLQLVKDVLVDNLGNALRLEKAYNLKFISMIVPEDNLGLTLIISYKETENNSFAVNATLTVVDKTCFKFRGIFIKI